MAQRFDERRNALVGATVPVVEQLRVDYGSRSRHFSVLSGHPFDGPRAFCFGRQ
jgi:hypothetical protein